MLIPKKIIKFILTNYKYYKLFFLKNKTNFFLAKFLIISNKKMYYSLKKRKHLTLTLTHHSFH